MAGNFSDNTGVMALAKDLGVLYTLDPTITPKMDGDTSIIALRIPGSDLKQVFHNQELVGNVEEFCAPPPAPGEDVMDGVRAAPVTPPATFLLRRRVSLCAVSASQRQCAAAEIPRHLAPFSRAERSPLDSRPGSSTCSTCAHVGTCTRCPGLAYMEGNMRGPSTADCEKSFQRTASLGDIAETDPSSLRRSTDSNPIPPQLGAKPQRCTKRCTRREFLTV